MAALATAYASYNKRAAPTPRFARLRSTPAQACGPLEAVLERVEERCLVGA